MEMDLDLRPGKGKLSVVIENRVSIDLHGWRIIIKISGMFRAEKSAGETVLSSRARVVRALNLHAHYRTSKVRGFEKNIIPARR